MIRINLLPYREAKRARQKQYFLLGLLAVLALGVLLCYGIYGIFSDRVADEQAKVAYLNGVTQQLDRKIASIADLRKKRDELLAREKVIEDLQKRRDLTVRIFNVLAHITPAGIFLTHLKEQGNAITLSGYAEANDQVAAFMRRIGASRIFSRPTLDIISKTKFGGEQVGQFTLQMQIREHMASASKTPTAEAKP